MKATRYESSACRPNGYATLLDPIWQTTTSTCATYGTIWVINPLAPPLLISINRMTPDTSKPRKSIKSAGDLAVPSSSSLQRHASRPYSRRLVGPGLNPPNLAAPPISKAFDSWIYAVLGAPRAA